jgi:hypothetical protein
LSNAAFPAVTCCGHSDSFFSDEHMNGFAWS